MLDDIIRNAAGRIAGADYWSARWVEEHSLRLCVRQGVAQPPAYHFARGAFLSVAAGGGLAYAATADLTRTGLEAAFLRAEAWARATARHSLIRAETLPRMTQIGEYDSPVVEPWESRSTADKWGILHDAAAALKVNDAIIDWQAQLAHTKTRLSMLTSDGGRIEQRFSYLAPGLVAIANRGAETQLRTGGGMGTARQGGLEQLASLGFADDAPRIAEEALQLLEAPQCPAGVQDLLLTPSQMMLQIHESIGHPLELDRILGDERNYAGTSFVTLDMFGRYRYGSELLNVTFDPARTGQLASYAFDDEGTPAERTYLIRHGTLERPLGGAQSQARAGTAGVAAARACHWNRPPIDRMANLNLEPGESSFDQLVGAVERGVLMDTNRSWSIDDSRNKFQFGCEYGRVIEDGELKHVVRNPGYRGLSETFWRSLALVGNAATLQVLGTPTCGKGEPNQAIAVGHAAPVCLFRNVEVFGGGLRG